MAKTIANCTMWVDSVNVQSQVNQVSIQASAAEVDITTFANAGMARIGGLKDAVISASGFWEALPDPDFTLFGDVGTNVPMTVALTRAAAAGDPAYLMCAQLAQYGGIGAKIGNPLAFSLRGAQNAGSTSSSGNAGRLAQGVLAENRTVTANGPGSVYQLRAPVAMQSIVAAVHAVAASGTTPSMTLQLTSANNPGMTGSTVRANFGAFTGRGSQILEIPGPITDTYWEFGWAITGTTPSFTFAASIGFAP